MTDVQDFDRLWDYAKPGETEARFRELLPSARRSDDPERLPQLLTQIARTQGLQGNFDDAHATLDEAEEHLDDATPIARVRLLLERGRAFNSAGRADDAKPLFRRAWDQGNAIGHEDYAIDAAHMLGIVESGATSVQWNERAIAAAEAATTPRGRGWLGPLYQNLGWTYHAMGGLERALELFRRGEAFHRERGNDQGRRILAWCVARTVRSLGRLEEALGLQRDLEADYREGGVEVSGFVDEEIGECRLALGHPIEELRERFRLAAEKLAKIGWVARSEPKRVERLAALGDGRRDD